MRILTLVILLALSTPGPSVSEPQTASEIVPTKLERITEILASGKLLYLDGEVKAGSDHYKEAVRLAMNLEPKLLQPTGSLNEQKARADLLLELGRAARSEGQPEIAQRYLDKSLELFQQTSGRQEPKIADVLMELADLHLRHGRRELGETLTDRALEIRIELYGPYHPDVAYIWALRGTQAKIDGDLAAAEEYFRRAVAAQEKSQPPTDNLLGHLYMELADVVKARGRFGQAAELEAKGREILAQNRM